MRNETKICLTVKSLMRADKILGQIQMEESLGNQVVLYPRDHDKLVAHIPILTGEELTKAAPLIGRTYDTYSRSYSEQQQMANALSVNVDRIEAEALPSILALIQRTHAVLNLTPAQEEYLLQIDEKATVRGCRIQDYACICLLRTKDLKNKPQLADRVWAMTHNHYYVLQPVLRSFPNMYSKPEEMFDNLRTLWDTRVKASTAIGGDELAVLLDTVQGRCKVGFTDGNISLELKPKDEEKPNEETPA
jgi:hypothetical protein